MGGDLVVGNVWTRLRRAQRGKKRRSWVAVAYFGKGAAKLLPLGRGSRLVVDASDNAVRSGQTCPEDLIVLLKRGTRIFNVPNLHAKIYVFGNVALIGSANASRNSARLVEAMFITRDREVVAECKCFVEAIAKSELGPERLKRLQKMYRPPKHPRGSTNGTKRRVKTRFGASLPGIRVAHLSRLEYSERDWAEHDVGSKIARGRREHRRGWKLDDFQWAGQHTYQAGDKIMMVTRENSGRQLVDPPGTVLYVRHYRSKVGKAALVFLELPDRRRRKLQSLANRLGRGALKRLRRNGSVTREISEKLDDLWEDRM
jgi:phospholipase D-like protein